MVVEKYKTVKEIKETDTVLIENGIEYYEENGIYYPKILLETEESEKIQLGRWGREWVDFLKTTNPNRYSILRRQSRLKIVAHEVEMEVYEMLEILERDYYKRYKPESEDFIANVHVREQGRMIAEEIVRAELIYRI